MTFSSTLLPSLGPNDGRNVYLLAVSHMGELTVALSAPERWYLTIVFVFELSDTIRPSITRRAWLIAPLLVCAAHRNLAQLRELPEPTSRYPSPQNNLWLRGLVRCMRGEDHEEITLDLACTGRTPSPGRFFQKHPLPQELTSALESFEFWYALTANPAGEERLDRLQHLLIDRRDIWLELLPYCISGQPDWIKHLNDSQKLLLGTETDGSVSQALRDASVYELSYMARNGIISDQDFRKQWKSALYNDEYDPPETDLFAVLVTKLVRPREFPAKQRALLKGLVGKRALSPRIIHVLRRDGIIDVEAIRSDNAFFQKLLRTVSPIRAKQLVGSGILKPRDFDLTRKLPRQVDSS